MNRVYKIRNMRQFDMVGAPKHLRHEIENALRHFPAAGVRVCREGWYFAPNYDHYIQYKSRYEDHMFISLDFNEYAKRVL